MSTSLDIYPFHDVPKGAACTSIAKYFSKLTGLAEISIDIAIHNEDRDGQMRWLKEDECLVFHKGVWYSVWEKNYVRAGATIDIVDAATVVENPSKYQSPLMSVSDIRLKKTPMLLLQLGAALGLAQAMGNEGVLHCGDFGWFVGLHKTSLYTSDDEELMREGYVNEFDIPFSVIDTIRNAEKAESLEQAVSTFFADKHEVS